MFAATLENAVGIEQPPPGAFYSTQATTYDALAAVPRLNYFPRSLAKRVLVVLTDGETRPLEGGLAGAFKGRRRGETVFVRFWNADERIYPTGVAEEGYRPISASGAALARVASIIGGRVLAEDEAGEVAGAVREIIGAGETIKRRHEGGRLALMPYVTLAALLPLGFVLLRRNVWWSGIPRAGRRTVRAPEGAKVSAARGVAQPG